MKGTINYIFLAFLFLTLISCEDSFHDGRFIGTWVSSDNNWVSDSGLDTLTFTSDDLFSKSLGDNIQHPYEYSYDDNSITIRYNGANLVKVWTTTHDYNLGSNKLTINFSDGGYGFESKEITYIKQ